MKKRKYTEAELLVEFNLIKKQENEPMPLLDVWLQTTTMLTAQEQVVFDDLLVYALQNIDFWNEEEVKMNFISSLLSNFVVYRSAAYRTYFEREISAGVDSNILKTKTDFMIAKGVLDLPQKPFFCFHEYKRKKNADDPVAQVLEAMLIAQAMNKNDKPIYGVYIMGRFWYFMVMDSTRTYSISKPYISTEKDQLLQIIAILRKFKVILETELLD